MQGVLLSGGKPVTCTTASSRSRFGSLNRGCTRLHTKSFRGRPGLFGEVDGAAAGAGAAGAGDLFVLLGEVVVDGEFFAFADAAEGEIQDVAFDDAGDDVRFAAMVDELGSAAVDG